MTLDEQKMIGNFIGRVVGGPQPPMDVEADAIIRALFVRNPDAAYRMTMLAMSLLKADSAAPEAAKQQSETANASPSARPDQPWLTSLFGRNVKNRHAIRS